MAVYEFDNISSNDKAKHPHGNLAIELLVPNAQRSNTHRLSMLSQHMTQYMQLKTPEVPRVFTNFENQIGAWSTNGYSKVESDCIILKKIVKNKYNYDLIVQYKANKKFDILHVRACHHIGAVSESYGVELIPGKEIAEANPGDELKGGQYITKTPSYDDDGNFMYGINLRADYIPYDGLNHEDAIVITKSAAEKMTTYKVKEIDVVVPTNVAFIDLYNKDNSGYHSFPHVGESTHGKILVASRPKNNKTLLYEFQHEKMKSIDVSDNKVFCPYNSKVVDIDVYTSRTPEELRATGDMFLCEIADVLEENNKYWEEMKSALEEIIPVATDEQTRSLMSQVELAMYEGELSKFKDKIDRPLPYEINTNSYTNELGYYWKLAHEYCNKKIKWRDDTGVIDNIKLKFTLLKENKISVGTKVTGRYGNKGVVSQIIDDEKAPHDTWGNRAEIILNPYGINNRMNWAQSFEQHINFMSNHVQHLIMETDDYTKKEKIFLSYLRCINHDQYFYYKKVLNSMTNAHEIADFYKSIETDGIYIHQFPFYGNPKSSGTTKQLPDWNETLTEIKNAKKAKQKSEAYIKYLNKVDEMNPKYIADTNLNLDSSSKEIWDAVKSDLIPISGNEEHEELNYFNKVYSKVSPQEIKDFWQDIEDNGPLFMPNFITIITEHPEWNTRYHNDDLEQDQIIGEEYFIVLKHDSDNKTSIRSAGTTNQKNLPLKTNNNKSHKSMYADSPIRLGRMEINNLLISKDEKMVNKLLRTYSTNKEDRHELIRMLLTSNKPFELRTFISNNKSISRVALDEYLKVLDLEITNVGGDD